MEQIIEVSSTIAAVTVFTEKAQVFRQAQVSLPVGTSKLLFRDLPAGLDRQTLQVGLHSDDAAASNVALKGISFDKIRTENKEFGKETEERKAAAQRIDKLQDEIQGVRDAKARAEAKMSFVEKSFQKAVMPRKQKECPAIADETNWERLAGKTLDTKAATRAEIRSMNRKLATLHDEIDLARDLLGRPVEKFTESNVVAVFLSSPEEVQKLSLQISYMMPEAKWSAAYDVRVDMQTCELNVTYNAVITQWTSEEWSDVKIELSTARPALSGKQPSLTPWRMNLFKERSTKAKKGMSFGMRKEEVCLDSAYGEVMDDDEFDLRAMVHEVAAINTSVTAMSFSVPRTHSVKNDGETPLRVSLVGFPLKAELSYVAVPKEAETAFAQAEAVNTSDFLMLPGSCSIFLSQQFIASSSLPRVASGEKFYINVGTDDAVSITRKLVSRQRSDEGNVLSGRKNKISYRYLTTIKNNKAKPITIEVQEQIPISSHGSIIVTLKDPEYKEDTPGLKFTEADGVLHVHLTVAAGASFQLPLHFTVVYPTELTIEGLI